MTPFGGDPIELRITEAVENELFVDEAAFDGVVIRTYHRIEPAGDTKVRIEISGPAAAEVGPALGPEISADFPDTIAALIERAEGLSHP
jgi:hypothetical protein